MPVQCTVRRSPGGSFDQQPLLIIGFVGSRIPHDPVLHVRSDYVHVY